MFISVTLLYEMGKRRSAPAIKAQLPIAGWLHYELTDYGGRRKNEVRARLVGEGGDELLPCLDHARLVACRGRSGALIEGIHYRLRGRKQAFADAQAWWCEAPPRTQPLLDAHARVLAAETAYARRKIAGWGDNE